MKLEDIVSGEERTKEIYHQLTGKELIYTRPPYGNINNQDAAKHIRYKQSITQTDIGIIIYLSKTKRQL